MIEARYSRGKATPLASKKRFHNLIPLVVAIMLFAGLAAAQSNRTGDIFSDIASRRSQFQEENLVVHQPPDLPDKRLGVQANADGAFQPIDKLDTFEEFQAELEKMREQYEPFMKYFAPEMPSARKSIVIDRFDWRLETEADRKDFRGVLDGEGEWEAVTIPHYGGPTGRATAYYRTTFEVTPEMLEPGALFIEFEGVDYIGHVFVNDAYIGSHEGFFAPFQFDVTPYVHEGQNVLVVKVENKVRTLSGGDKIYAASGPGWDDPETGWQHCPPGMGIYQRVRLESRPRMFINDVFVRPKVDEGRAEAWIEVYNCDESKKEVTLDLSVYGRNFQKTVVEHQEVTPSTDFFFGLGDMPSKNRPEGYRPPLTAGHGVNLYRVPFELADFRYWSPEEPWLYEIQIQLLGAEKDPVDYAEDQFGMRSFRMDENSDPKGRFYLNGKEIRLRGANTMGHMQQCVIREDWDQLRDDILIAKIANMNFWRLTQRPVQDEIYDYCDRLGIMTQTDLPLFGCMRRPQFEEGVRQAYEMERLVRSHPCNIIDTYINEPFPNGNNQPQRNLTRQELLDFFEAASISVRRANPDRVIKPVDGDYDPPAPGLPDNHCYPGWYNGHAVPIGKLHRGYWVPIKPGWCYGCGEFGAEGMDSPRIMKKYYPDAWLSAPGGDQSLWSPKQIKGCQSGMFHYMWFDDQDSMQTWSDASRKHQAWADRIVTEAFRRKSHMNTFAIHLLIDAFPSSWMKTIVDYDRRPKPAYYVYRDLLTPLIVSLRTDRYSWFGGESMPIEAWVCNDKNEAPEGAALRYQMEIDGDVVASGRAPAEVPALSVRFQGYLDLQAPDVTERQDGTVRLALVDADGRVLHDTSVDVDIFPAESAEPSSPKRVWVPGDANGPAARLASDLGLDVVSDDGELTADEIAIVDDPEAYAAKRGEILDFVKSGGTAVLLAWPEGDYQIAGTDVEIRVAGMSPYFFASRKTGHPLVEGFRPLDFRFWYSADKDYVVPIVPTTMQAEGWTPIVQSGNSAFGGGWRPSPACAELKLGDGRLRLCLLTLSGLTKTNPVASIFAQRLLGVE